MLLLSIYYTTLVAMHSPSQDFFVLMARAVSGEATAEEQQQLANLLQQDEQLQQQYEAFISFWKFHEPEQNTSITEEDEQHVARILAMAQQEDAASDYNVLTTRRRTLRYKRFLVPFIILIAVVAGFFYLNSQRIVGNASLAKHVLVAANGSHTRTVLPDGSSVWLNAGSKIIYANHFDGNIREVTLQGEAFFDVVKQPQRPFVVHTSGIDIKVLGTAFNVKSYPADKTVETTLIRGLVEVRRENNSSEKPIVLHPNEKLVVAKVAAQNNKSMSVNNTPVATPAPIPNFYIVRIDSSATENDHIETAWLYNRLAFRGDDFEELARKLERWYNVEIFFEDEAVKHVTFNGSFENETIQQAFDALQAAVPFSYRIEGEKIFVRSK